MAWLGLRGRGQWELRGGVERGGLRGEGCWVGVPRVAAALLVWPPPCHFLLIFIWLHAALWSLSWTVTVRVRGACCLEA